MKTKIFNAKRVDKLNIICNGWFYKKPKHYVVVPTFELIKAVRRLKPDDDKNWVCMIGMTKSDEPLQIFTLEKSVLVSPYIHIERIDKLLNIKREKTR